MPCTSSWPSPAPRPSSRGRTHRRSPRGLRSPVALASTEVERSLHGATAGQRDRDERTAHEIFHRLLPSTPVPGRCFPVVPQSVSQAPSRQRRLVEAAHENHVIVGNRPLHVPRPRFNGNHSRQPQVSQVAICAGVEGIFGAAHTMSPIGYACVSTAEGRYVRVPRSCTPVRCVARFPDSRHAHSRRRKSRERRRMCRCARIPVAAMSASAAVN